MKRIFSLFLCLLLFFVLPLTAGAREADSFETAYNLYEYWIVNDCLPDYITGIWTEDGSLDVLTFGLVPGEEGEKAKAEILSLLRNDDSVIFVTQTYSRNYLLAIMEDVNLYFEQDLGFKAAGPNEYENRVCIELDIAYEHNPESLAAIAELQKKYGDAVAFSFTDTVIQLTVLQASPLLFITPPVQKEYPSPLPLLLLCPVLLWGLHLIRLRRRQLMTHTGITLYESMTTQAVEESIRECQPRVPDTLEQRIMDSLK